MSKFKPTYKRFNEKAILIEWPFEISETILSDVLNLKKKIENALGYRIIEARSAYQSILVLYTDYIFDEIHAIKELEEIYNSMSNAVPSQSKLWKIPVCYHADFSLDIEEITQSKNLSKDDVIRLHSEAIYTVYFIGFLPGFLYLGGLNERLFTPRKEIPRRQIEKGAVAIGGNQTGVYPNESPGGWNIIGNSPIDFFNHQKEKPCFAKAGDRIQFVSVSLKEYVTIKALVKSGVYNLESEQVV
ncbi:5-oxoprolinase subunit PxpB [uncultured Algibacter sp.]|uniref:5-oxoprolinase subunit PxpB n=1 Tax=uncultured Algibacter sp. TaxID=298659 RepID=UPI0026352827|nr:5-oxoprolinase subunit PxpB [uncultured Algibacter sp.]